MPKPRDSPGPEFLDAVFRALHAPGDFAQRETFKVAENEDFAIVGRELFQCVGFFDEGLPDCEDYDLWLRVSSRYAVHLIDIPLIVKRGGHPDQLSRTAGLDKFGISAIVKLLGSDRLSIEQRRAAVRTLKRKCTVYAGGCRKRGRMTEAEHFEQLAQKISDE